MPKTDSTQPAFQLLLTPDRAALRADGPTTLRVLARVQAPAAPSPLAARAPLHLALVLDRSGSMSGTPLEEAKRCARHIVDGLAPGDRAAVFAFDDEVVCIAPLTPAVDKLALASALATIACGGSTNLHGGWRAGADELAGKLAGDGVHRVILLSDGCANAGETDTEAIAAQCKELAKGGVMTSTYGLGHDFNEALMLAMAGAGRGNAYYGQSAADLAEPFAAEFALLASLCARGMMLKVNAPANVDVRLRNDYLPVDGETHAWHLPDLAFASEAWVLLELAVGPGDGNLGTMVTLPITVSVQAAAHDSAPLFPMTSLPALSVVDATAYEAMPLEALVMERSLELDAADALADVRAAIDTDDWARAQRLVDAAAARFSAHPWAASIVATMQRLIAERDKRLAAKEASFSALRMRSRLAATNEPSFCALDQSGIPAFLRRKSEQGKGSRDG